MTTEITTDNIVRALNREFLAGHPVDAARILDHAESRADVEQILADQSASVAARLLLAIDPDLAGELAEHLESEEFRRIFGRLESHDCAEILSRLPEARREERLASLSPGAAREIRDLLLYPENTAGSLMHPSATSFHPGATVDEVLQRIRKSRNKHVIDICIVDEERRLVGVVSLQDVATSAKGTLMRDLVKGEILSIPDLAQREDVVQVFETGRMAVLPVVDAQGRLVGMIRYDTLVHAAREDASEDLQMMFGAGREERALSPVLFAVRKRLPWLEVNLATAFLAAAVVGFFESTIAQITALAVFLPVVAGQSGNTGSQALAVTMRGLLLREIKGSNWFRMARKEMAVAFVNGLAVALTTSVIAYVWMGSAGLAAIIGAAMIFSMVVAGFFGAVIPSVLKAMGQDPAQSSSIILTTVTDIAGFLSFLGLAKLMINYI
ncbi:MAG: magnesium transporter [bacterium]|nr:magnesium transporter [bacterium]